MSYVERENVFFLKYRKFGSEKLCSDLFYLLTPFKKSLCELKIMYLQ